MYNDFAATLVHCIIIPPQFGKILELCSQDEENQQMCALREHIPFLSILYQISHLPVK